MEPTLSLPEPHLKSRQMGQLQLFWCRFKRHRLALAGAVALTVVIMLTVFAPLVSGQNPNKINLRDNLKAPSETHLLGTDEAGRDMYARLLYGGRVSLAVGFVSVVIRGIIGIALGALAGYFGGKTDQLIMRVTDVFMCFPQLILMIVAAAILGPSIFNAMIVIGIFSWAGLCRLVRAQFLRLRASDYVLAARCLGVPSGRIILRHILPNGTGPIIVALAFGVAGGILSEAGLSFLGLGVLIPTASWGNMMAAGQSLTVMQSYPWLWIPPALVLSVVVLAINYVGEGLQDAFDPRLTRR